MAATIPLAAPVIKMILPSGPKSINSMIVGLRGLRRADFVGLQITGRDLWLGTQESRRGLYALASITAVAAPVRPPPSPASARASGRN
jgi:hypothetical protein